MRLFEVEILVEGVNFSTILDNIRTLRPKKVERVDPTHLKIVCNVFNRKKVLAILHEKCYNILKQNTSSFLSFWSIFKRAGILVGLSVALGINILLSFFVWDFRLIGDQALCTQILSALESQGITRGAFRLNLRQSEIEKILYENVPNLSLCDVSFRGSTMIISFSAKTDKTTTPAVTQNILAKNDGVIASISTLSGTAMVKPGDYVKKGDILIAGYDQNGECLSRGQVFAYRWISASVEFPLESVALARTGQFVTETSLSFLGETISQTKCEVPFEKFEEEISSEYLATSSPLPILVTTKKIFELEEVQITRDYQSEKEKLFAQAKLLAQQNLSGEETILDEKDEVNFVAGVYFVSHYIKIKEKIS